MWECHSDGRNLTKWLNLLSIFLDFYELRRNWGSKTNIQQKKISQYPALLISHLLITHIYLIYISSSNRVERLATVKVDPSHWKSICKTLRKYSASNYQGSLKMLSNPTTRHSWCRPEVGSASCRKSIWKTLRKFPASGHERGLQVLSNRLESNDSSRLMSTRHTGSRFARYLENITQVVTKRGYRFSRIERIP